MPGAARISGRLNLVARVAVVAAALPSAAALAGAFFHESQSVRSAGRASAGAPAAADEASTIFLNPAGLTQLSGPQVQVGSSLLMPRGEVEDRGSTARTPGTGGAAVPITGSQNGHPFDPAIMPHAYAAFPLVDGRLWLGLGVSAPFGLITDYREDWFGRYDSTKSELTTIDVAPTLAVKLSDWVSIGAGLDVQYADATLENAVPNPTAPGGPSPATDARFQAQGDDWSVGFNVGLLVRPTPQTRIGLQYRSGIEHKLEGDATLSGLAPPLDPQNGTTGASAELDLPPMASIGVAHDVTQDLTLLGHVAWYGWDTFDEIRVRFDDGRADVVEPQNYRDSWAIGLGAEYRLTDSWTLRGGVSYDQTPTSNGFRNTRVPDGDRYWIAVGASYELSDRIGFDVAYGHRFFENTDIDRTRTFFEGLGLDSDIRTSARAKTDADVVSAALRISF
jgi:long-chain fatty acid transport protein